MTNLRNPVLYLFQVSPVEKEVASQEPVRLSYAQMVQRTKEREAEQRAKHSDDTSKESASAKDAGANGTSTRPAALREQSQMTGVRLNPRPDHLRKDRERGDDPRDQRLMGRRAKENRDRRAGDRDRDRDRFRDRRRDREVEPRSTMKWHLNDLIQR